MKQKTWRKYLALLLALVMLTASTFSALSEGEPSAEIAPETASETITEAPAEPPEPTATPEVTQPEQSEAAATATPSVATDTATPSVAETATVSPEASAMPTVAFLQGLVLVKAEEIIYADAELTVAFATVAQDGVVYAAADEQDLSRVHIWFTLDGVTLLEGYLKATACVPLTADELANYQPTAGTVLWQGYPLLPIAVVPQVTPTPAPLPLGRVATGTVLYADSKREQMVGTVLADGVVYVGDAAVVYSADGITTAQAYLPKDVTPTALTQEEETADQAQTGGVPYQDIKLYALSLQPYNYTLSTYGFPGLKDTAAFGADRLAEKQMMTTSGAMADFREMVSGENYVEGEVFVNVSSEEEAQTVAESYNATVVTYYDMFGFALLKLDDQHTTAQAMEAAADMNTRLVALSLNSIRQVEKPHQDAPVGKPSARTSTLMSALPTLGTWATQKTNDPFLLNPNDTSHLSKRFINLTSGYQYMQETVGAYAAWGLTKGSSNVKVFVLDSGVLAAHEDLTGKVTDIKPGFTLGATTSISGNLDPHGTHVAGIIAATAGNGKGGAGIAPGVSILAYRGDNDSNKGSFTTAAIVDGLAKAISKGAYLVNMSLGGPEYNSAENTAVQKVVSAGIPIFAAEGNDGSQQYNYPAHYNNVISVASTDNNNTRSSYSTYAAATLSAPGSNILSSAWGSTQSTSTYQSYDGTSMACPVAVGCAALYYSARGTQDLNGDGAINQDDVAYLRKVLTANTTPIVGSSAGMGAGIINIGKVFSTMTGKPTFKFSPDVTSLKNVSTESSITITGGWNGQFIVYTLDGSNPTVKNGEVTNGIAGDGSPSASGEQTFTTTVTLENLTVGNQQVKAITVNAQGNCSAVATQSFTIDDQTPDSLAISTATEYLAVGKAFTFKATATPASLIKPTWSIVSGNEYAGINAATGALKGLKAGTVEIRASMKTATGDVIDSSTQTLQIVPLAVKSIKFAPASISMNTLDVRTLTPTILMSNGAAKAADDNRKFDITTSNSAVLTINAGGDAVAVNPGTAKVTWTATDGSNVKGTLTVKVIQPVNSISIGGYQPASDGYGRVAAGKKMALTAQVIPVNATNKKLTWTLDDTAKTNKVTISGSGVLSVPATYTSGEQITVTCTANDGSGTASTAVFTVNPAPLASLTLTSSDARVTYSRGILSGGNVFTADIPETMSVDETELQLLASTSDVPVIWASSNPKAITVDANGLLRAMGTGAAKITCTASDGSGKSASATFKAIVPASNINVYSDSSKLSLSYPTIAYGKSRKFYATVGSTYGAPTVKKVTWQCELRYYNSSIDVYNMEKSGTYSTTTSPYVKISADGTVSVSTAFSGSSICFLKIISTATDGTGVVGCTYARLTLPSTFKAMKGVYDLYDGNGNYVGTYQFPTSLTISKNYKPDGGALSYDSVCFYGSDINDDFALKSSNPSVASPLDYPELTGYYVSIGNIPYPVYEQYIKADNVGSATITISTNDGTNQSASFSVKVTE